MREQTATKPIVVGCKVKHIKSNSRSSWYRKLVDGRVVAISPTGKTAYVQWIDKNRRVSFSSTYKIENLQHIEEEVKQR